MRASRDGLSDEGAVKFLIRQQFHPVPCRWSAGKDARFEDYTKGYGQLDWRCSR